MPANAEEGTRIRIGVDVGGTFTDLVGLDGRALRIVKVPSTPPAFHHGVRQAIDRYGPGGDAAAIVHGSTVATNALLQRAGAAAAFITTEGFRDMLLIGRQNRPKLYALHVRRSPPITTGDNCFTVRERIDSQGRIVEPLAEDQIDRLIAELQQRGLKHAAVCLLFGFVNPEHEQRLKQRLEQAGITTSLSSELLPEFREYERASTTAINASLRPVVAAYLDALEQGLKQQSSLRIMHSAGGTLAPREAAEQAARLVLSGPAGGVIGAAWIARQAQFEDIITYDMGGTSTDVATILGGRPQWTTSSTIDGLPIALPMFDIHTIGAGGGSIACVDTGGALRVGPRSAGADPGAACYGRGGGEPTVTDANLLLGRILPEHFLGGQMKIDRQLARTAVAALGRRIGRDEVEAALGIIRIAEANMTQAIRAVTARRGHDPRQFTLVSFGGAGGLHACALAEALEIPRVLVPPHCGVLSALGMIVAPALADVSQTVVHLGAQLDDARIAAEFGRLNMLASEQLPPQETAAVETFADVRFRGQSHEVKVQVRTPQLEHIEQQFRAAYGALYGSVPDDERTVEVVTLRLRRIGHEPELALPEMAPDDRPPAEVTLINAAGRAQRAPALSRGHTVIRGRIAGPALLLDPEATTYLPQGWTAEARAAGGLILNRQS